MGWDFGVSLDNFFNLRSIAWGGAAAASQLQSQATMTLAKKAEPSSGELPSERLGEIRSRRMANRFECYVRYCVPSERLFVICGSAVRRTEEGRESNTACGGPIEVVLLTETKHIPWVPVQIASKGKRPIKRRRNSNHDQRDAFRWASPRI